jgi:hypothetical protein
MESHRNESIEATPNSKLDLYFAVASIALGLAIEVETDKLWHGPCSVLAALLDYKTIVPRPIQVAINEYVNSSTHPIHGGSGTLRVLGGDMHSVWWVALSHISHLRRRPT